MPIALPIVLPIALPIVLPIGLPIVPTVSFRHCAIPPLCHSATVSFRHCVPTSKAAEVPLLRPSEDFRRLGLVWFQ